MNVIGTLTRWLPLVILLVLFAVSLPVGGLEPGFVLGMLVVQALWIGVPWAAREVGERAA